MAEQTTITGTNMGRFALVLCLLVLAVDFAAIIKDSNVEYGQRSQYFSNPIPFDNHEHEIGFASEKISSYRAARFSHFLQTNANYSLQSTWTPLIEKWTPNIYISSFGDLVTWFESNRYNSKSRLSGWKDGNSLYKSLSLAHS